MKLDFDEGVALVAGGSGGIGSAIVRRLADSGLPVALTFHRGREAADALLEAGPNGGRIVAYPWGAPSFEDAVNLVQSVRKDLGPVQYLVIASGVAQEAAFHRLTEADARRILDANLASAISLAHAAMTPMMKSGSGRVVFIGSVAGRRGMKGQTVYAASKAGLEGLTRSLAREAGLFGVTVNCVSPGFIETGMTERLPRGVRDEWLKRIPLGRPGSVEEVAQLVTFVLSRQGAYLTGQSLVVDGGLSA
jgi:NAD(P)-dependent dehydrogenase (short-subunit alcohol dehydrogenase family)